MTKSPPPAKDDDLQSRHGTSTLPFHATSSDLRNSLLSQCDLSHFSGKETKAQKPSNIGTGPSPLERRPWALMPTECSQRQT